MNGSIQKIWNAAGLQIQRLFPIILMVFMGGVVLIYLGMDVAKINAQSAYRYAYKEAQLILAPVLAELAAQDNAIASQALLQQRVASFVNVDHVSWVFDSQVMNVESSSGEVLNPPARFVRWVSLSAEEKARPVIVMGKNYGSLKLHITPVPFLNKVWKYFLLQLQSLLAITVIMLVMVSLVLRYRLAALRQLVSTIKFIKWKGKATPIQGEHLPETHPVAEANHELVAAREAMQCQQQSLQAQLEQTGMAQQLIAALPVPIYYKSSEGIFLGVNAAWEEMFGIQAENIIGRSVHDLFAHAPNIAQWQHTMDTERMQVAATHIYETILLMVDGRELEVICHEAPFSGNSSGTKAGMVGAIVDITSLKQIETALSRQKEQAELTLASIGEAVITTDTAGYVQMLNSGAMQLTGWSLQDAQGQSLGSVFNVVNENSRQASPNIALLALAEGNCVQESNSILLARNGKEYSIEFSAAPIRNKEGKAAGCVIVFHDVSEKHHLIEQMSWQAGHDTLTNLPNRVLLSDRIKRAIASAQRHNKLLAVCLLDLDEFKPVNDKFGHEIGDRLLVEVAERLVVTLRGGDTVARLGGDEFILLLNDLKDMDEMEPALNRILEAIAAPYIIQGIPIVVSASIGVSVYPFDDSDPDTLMRHADQGMYLAKQSGRNRIRMFDAEQDALVQDRHLKLERVRKALQHGEFVVYYQPKVNMRSGEVIGMEALLRWQHPERGLVVPMDFLPLVEQSDLIVDIGEWVMHEVLGQIASWANQGKKIPVSVNIAAHHLQQQNFVARLTDILRRHPTVSPRQLELEILESVVLGDIQFVRSVISACQLLGVTFSLDDFGTGYSSLTYLKQLPANTLKIDQSFIRNMLDDKEDLALVEGIISLASVFNRDIIAEGVETVEHGVMLMRLGCDTAQGYGIARPMPAEAVDDWVSQFVPDPRWAQWADRNWELSNFPLLVAQYDHVKWVKRVLMAVDENSPLQLSQAELVDHHHCRFGHWYYGHGKMQYGSLPEFLEIEEVHNKVHEIGPEIIRLKDMGDLKGAQALCADLVVLREQILGLLENLQRVVSQPR